MLLGSSFSYESYWSEFEITDDDLDFIYNLLLEREIPLQTREMCEALVQYRLERAEEEAKQADETEHSVYLPVAEHSVGQVLVFPAVGNLVGSVVSVRAGENPDVGPFKVIQVSFGDEGPMREFASCLEDHILNQPPEPSEEVDALRTVEGVLEAYGESISERIEVRCGRKVQLREPDVVTQHFRFADLRKPVEVVAKKRRIEGRFSGRFGTYGRPPRTRSFEDEGFHARACLF